MAKYFMGGTRLENLERLMMDTFFCKDESCQKALPLFF